MDDPTLSGRVEIARVCRVAVAVLALAFGVMLVALGDDADQIIPGMMLIGITVVVSLLGLLARIPFPELLPHTERFSALLTSAVFPVAGIVVSVGFSIGWFILTWPKLTDIFSQAGAPPKLWSFETLVGLGVFLPVLGGVWLAVALARSAPWRVRGDGAGFLRVWFVSRFYTFRPAALRVWCVGGGPAGRIVALHLSDGRRTVILPAGAARSRQEAFLDQLAEWLRERGAEVTAGRPVATEAAWRGWARQGALLGTGLSCIFLPWGVVWAGLFWGEWLREGTWSANMLLRVFPWCWVASLVCLASPLFGWLRRLFGGLWLEGLPSAGLQRVTVIEGLHANEVFTGCARSGLLGGEGEALRLVVGQTEYRIPREAILELKPWGLIKKIVDCTCEPFYRLLARPIRLTWRAEEDGKPVIHAVLLAVRGGMSNGQERRLDRVLWQRLDAWLRDGAPFDLSGLKTSTARPGAFVAALFIIFCLAVPPIHNHLIRTRIATGAWPPPARPLPASELIPDLNTMISSIPPEGMLFFNTFQRNNPTSDVFRVPLFYWGDPSGEKLRPVTYGLRLLYKSALSFPGPPTHAWCSGETLLGTLLIPPQLKESLDFPPCQIVDLRTGQGRRLASFEQFSQEAFSSVTALDTGGKRLFYAVDKRSENGGISDKGEFGWVDAASDTLHSVGRVPFDLDRTEKPYFFPGGRYVLCQWHILDLESGSVRPVTPEVELGWKHEPGDFGIFALGKSLVRRVKLSQSSIPLNALVRATVDPVTGFLIDHSTDAPNPETDSPMPFSYTGVDPVTGQPAGTPASRDEYWEIDPVSARRRTIALPPNTYLLSADEDRWLVVERAPEPAVGKVETPAEKDSRLAIPREFSLFSPTTRRVRPLFRERRAGRYFLVQGRDEILVCSEKNVWSRRAIVADK